MPKFFVDGSSGDVSFYEDTGTTAKMYWDASAESLGIGTTSPGTELEVNGDITGTDLFLSGGAYLGGTGAANYLDDYEEGTWTPVFTAGLSGVTYTIQKGFYTKIGNTVTFSIFMIAASATATANRIKISLPFTSQNTSYYSSGGYFTYGYNLASAGNPLPTVYIGPGNAFIDLYTEDGASFTGNDLVSTTDVNLIIRGSYAV